MKKVIAISGSTRKISSNGHLINAIAALAKNDFIIHVFDGLMSIPAFNPDDDNDNPPTTVQNFRQLLKEADGILICTPEYAMGVPGSLKNAIDWTVSSMEFSNKPTALITASLSGQKAHVSLLETLKVIEAKMEESTQLLISFIKTKVSAEGIVDPATRREVEELVVGLKSLMSGESLVGSR